MAITPATSQQRNEEKDMGNSRVRAPDDDGVTLTHARAKGYRRRVAAEVGMD
jgi:hypothetical protein